jgi:hypothetical protein
MSDKDFVLDNVWVDEDSRVSDVDTCLPPSPPWIREELWKHFWPLKTKLTLVNGVFCCLGNLEAKAYIDEADHFDHHITR